MLVPACVVLCVSWSCGARSHWNGCMMLHAVCRGEEAGARNLAFFRVKWLQPAMKGTWYVRRLRLGSFGSFYVFCNNACSCVRSSMRFLTLWCQIALEWLHDVAWALCWGGSRRTKPCVFPCKVAAAGNESYLVCAAVAAGVVWFLLCVLQRVVVPVCVVLCVSWRCGARSHWNGCMMLHAVCCGEEAGARNRAFSRVKWLQPAMKATSSVRRLRLGSFGSFYVFCNNACSCVHSSMRFLKLWCQIALEWLHDVACRVLWGGSRSTKPCVFPCKVAAAGDESYLVCAAVAAGVVWFLLCVLQQCLFLCA